MVQLGALGFGLIFVELGKTLTLLMLGSLATALSCLSRGSSHCMEQFVISGNINPARSLGTYSKINFEILEIC